MGALIGAILELAVWVATQIILIPFRLIFAYIDFFDSLGEREAALARASHGTMFALAGCISLVKNHSLLLCIETQLYHRYDIFIANEIHMPLDKWGLPALALTLLTWGLVWIRVGAGWRSRGVRDGLLISRSIVKLAGGIYFGFVGLIFGGWWQLLWFVSPWMIITAIVKLLLVLRGMPKPDVVLVPQGIYGEARFIGDEEVKTP